MARVMDRYRVILLSTRTTPVLSRVSMPNLITTLKGAHQVSNGRVGFSMVATTVTRLSSLPCYQSIKSCIT